MFLERLDTVIAFAIVMLLLSLLVTTLVQMAQLITQRRGRNLQWAVERLLTQVGLTSHAKTIANELLKHPTVSHTKNIRAVAIRKEELTRLLFELAKDDSPLPDRAKNALTNALKGTTPEATAQQIAHVQAMAASLMDLLPSQAAAVQKVVGDALARTDKVASEIDAWFDTIMDRASERFKLHSRWITAIVAAGLALGMQIDSLDILRQLGNKEIRAEVLKLYEPVMGLHDQAQKLQQRQAGLASDTILEIRKDPKLQPFIGAAAGEPKAKLERPDQGKQWLETNFAANATQEDKEKVLRHYQTLYDQNADKLYTEVRTASERPLAMLETTGLIVVPKPSWPWPPRKWAGIIATALFLSLGAPFWYNALRKLADLRPIVARRVEGEAPKAVR